jgi:hypothetical protein
LGLPTCVAAPAPGVETSLVDALGAEVRQHAFAVSCDVDASHLGMTAETCAISASNCAEWLSCASGGHCPDYCADHSGDSCDGDRAVQCDYLVTAKSYGRVFEDCGAEGMHCVAGACTTGTACSPSTSVHCNGTRIESCNGTLYSFDCGPAEICVEGDVQGLHFVGCGHQQCTPSLPMCDGNTMNACFLGDAISLDCSQPPYSGTCTNVQGTNTCVAPPGPCSDGDPDHCDGTTLEHCMLNQWRPVDCVSIGFSSCANGICTK